MARGRETNGKRGGGKEGERRGARCNGDGCNGEDKTGGEEGDGADVRRRGVIGFVIVQVVVQRGADGRGAQQQQQRGAQDRDESAEERESRCWRGRGHAAVRRAEIMPDASRAPMGSPWVKLIPCLDGGGSFIGRGAGEA